MGGPPRDDAQVILLCHLPTAVQAGEIPPPRGGLMTAVTDSFCTHWNNLPFGNILFL